MKFTTSIVALVAMLSAAGAAPHPAPEPELSPNDVVARAEGDLVKRSTATASVFSGSGCSGSKSSYYTGNTASTICWSQGGNSIQVTGSGCTTRTWSGGNCGGSSYTIPDSNCRNVPFASVSFNC